MAATGIDQEKSMMGYDVHNRAGSSEGSHEHATAHDAAAHGHVATDSYGNALVTFDAAAESRLRLKIDLYTVPTVTIIYLMCFVDRANIGNARLAGLEADLGMSGYDYNLVLSVFYIPYIIFELPSNMACKYFGPGWFIPSLTLGFGAASIATAFVQTRAQMCGVRFVLGVFGSWDAARGSLLVSPICMQLFNYVCARTWCCGRLVGTLYNCVYPPQPIAFSTLTHLYSMSRWYRRSELAFRLSIYIAMGAFGGAFGGLLASGILTLDRFGSLTEWRMIFAIEGIITVVLAIISFFAMTDRPETARWLSETEKDLAIARVKSERIGVTEVLDKISWAKTRRGITSPVTTSTSAMFFFTNITVQGLAFFLPTIVRTIYPNATVVSQQLRTVPPYMVGTFFTCFINFLSWRLDKRNLMIHLSALPVMAGYIMFLGTTNRFVRYAGTFFITSGAFANGALSNAQVSANLLSDTARSSGIGMNVMMGNVGGLVATWSYLPFDGPNYPIGNGLNLGSSGAIFVLSGLLFVFMKWDNKRRERVDVAAKLDGLSTQEVEDLDWKHPGFRWRA